MYNFVLKVYCEDTFFKGNEQNKRLSILATFVSYILLQVYNYIPKPKTPNAKRKKEKQTKNVE